MNHNLELTPLDQLNLPMPSSWPAPTDEQVLVRKRSQHVGR